jgi:hypothetical protein
MFADELAVLPTPTDDPADFNGHDAAPIERGVDQTPVCHRRGRGMGILGQLARRLLPEDFLVPEDLPVIGVNADHVTGCPVWRG